MAATGRASARAVHLPGRYTEQAHRAGDGQRARGSPASAGRNLSARRENAGPSADAFRDGAESALVRLLVSDSMTVGKFPGGLQLGSNIPFIQVGHLAARNLRRRGDTTCQAPNPRWPAGGGTVFETAHCSSPLRPASRAPRATGKPCSETGSCENAAELPATNPAHARRFLDAGSLTSRSGRTYGIGPGRCHGFGRRPIPDLHPAKFSWTSDLGDAGERDTNGLRSATTAGVREPSMQIDFDAGPGPDVALHQEMTGCSGRRSGICRSWRTAVSERLPSRSVLDRSRHAPSAAAPSNGS